MRDEAGGNGGREGAGGELLPPGVPERIPPLQPSALRCGALAGQELALCG